jgi:hypothetical protein
MTSIDHGFIPIVVQARYFAGRINAMLDDAISSATTLRFAELASTCATANVTPLVIVDALNECASEFRPTLIPALQDLRIHSDARIIIRDAHGIAFQPTRTDRLALVARC